MGQFRVAADIVFVVDLTGSMRPVLDAVKTSALRFHQDLVKALADIDREVSQLRVRVVGFRDFGRDREALVESPFFVLPGESTQYAEFVKGLTPSGGGDNPESGLEALWVAMQSDWERGFDKARHVIVVFTDDAAHPLGTSPNVPDGIARTDDELAAAWYGDQGSGMDQSAKRLLIFAPDLSPWREITGSDQWAWDQALQFQSRAGQGLADATYDTIIGTIAQSI